MVTRKIDGDQSAIISDSLRKKKENCQSTIVTTVMSNLGLNKLSTRDNGLDANKSWE